LIFNLKNSYWRAAIFFFLSLSAKGAAQRVALESAVYQGNIWRHTPKLSTQTGETLRGQELGLRFQTTGRRDWHGWQRYPALGLSALHFRLGEGSHRRVFAFLPTLSIPLIRYKWLAAQFRLGTGLAWVARPYDGFRNPQQNAIGSHWNNVTQFRAQVEARLSPHFRLNAGAGLTHFSNGGSALPNFGINLPAAHIGAAWFPRALREADFAPPRTSKRAVSRRVGVQCQSGLTLLEYGAFDGPKYPVWLGSAAGIFRFNRVSRLALGIDYEYNSAVAAFGRQTAQFDSPAAARRGATRLAWTAAGEFLFGPIGIQLQTGQYLGGRFNASVPTRRYAKLSARGYLPKPFRSSPKPFVGISLKAHKFTAEYISANVGLEF
jgi:hypothetical protein